MKYQIGDYLVHEGSGVCQVIDIDDLELMGKGSKKTYYLMTPVYKADAKVFSPVDGASLKIRPVATKDVFSKILRDIDKVKYIDEKNDRLRGDVYKAVMSEFTPEALASVVKTVLIREWARVASGKKIMAQDEKMLNTAGKKLYEEMAFSMGLEVKEVQQMFEERVKTCSQEIIEQFV